MMFSTATHTRRKASLLRRLFPLMLALVMGCGAVVSLFTLRVFDQQVSAFNTRVIAQEARTAATLWRNAAQELAARTFSLGEAQAFANLVPLSTDADAADELPADRRLLIQYLQSIMQAKPGYISLRVVIKEPSGERQVLGCEQQVASGVRCAAQPYQPGSDPLLDAAIAVDLPHLHLGAQPESMHQARVLQTSTPFSNLDFRVHGHIVLQVDTQPLFGQIQQGLSAASRAFLHNPTTGALFFMDHRDAAGDIEHAIPIRQSLQGQQDSAGSASIISSTQDLGAGESLGGYALGVFDPGTTRRGILERTVYLNLGIQLVVILIFMLAALVAARHVSEPIRKLRVALETYREDIQESNLPQSADYDLSRLFDVILDNYRRIKLQRRSLAERYAAQKATRRQLEIALQRIQRAELDKNELVKVTAHDLREPLLIIKSCSRLLPELLEEQDHDGLGQSVGFIEDNVVRMMTQVERMRRYFRIGISSEIVPVDIRACCLETLSAWDPSALDGAQIQVHGEATLNSRLEDMQLILRNLLENALTHARHEEPLNIEVRIEEQDDGCCISVCDDGVGIAPERHEKIFDLFSRADSAHTITGTGTGLSEVRHIAYLHGGDAQIFSNPERGVTFKVSLYHLNTVDEMELEELAPLEPEIDPEEATRPSTLQQAD